MKIRGCFARSGGTDTYWRWLAGILLLLSLHYVGPAVQAQTAMPIEHAHQLHHAAAEHSSHRTPTSSHCATPVHASCCPCIPAPLILPSAHSPNASYPPAPRRLDFHSRLIGPALPPPRRT